jgi:hypothetical protein
MTKVATNQRGIGTPERPGFAVTLGLLPPYTMEDVKRAYLAKVKDAHPDRGGDRAEFERIHGAFLQAGEYLKFRGDRRQWIAARMEEYLGVLSLLERLQALGAEVETVTHDWLQKSFGDFADLTASIVAIHYRRADGVGELIDTLVGEQAALPGLKQLDLASTPVTDAMALQLRVFQGLTHLDLSRTKISSRATALVDWLPELRSLNLDGTSVGWWARRGMQKTLARRVRGMPALALHPLNVR